MRVDIIVEYLCKNGLLTAASGRPFDYVTFNHDGTVQIWSFPEQQPDFAAVAATPEYINYEANRDAIIEKENNEKRFDTNKLDIAVYEVMVEEFNRRRKFERDLLVAVAAATTLANLKSGISVIATQNANITLSDAKQLVKNKL